MGQYWYAVNLDKRESVCPHRLGAGLKLWEQLAAHPGTGAALVVLCAAMPEPRGGGDFDLSENWHGPERDATGAHGGSPGPMPKDYPSIAARTIGRWAGDRIALVGDYAEDSDLAPEHKASDLYAHASDASEANGKRTEDGWLDVSEDVAAVIEHELGGKYEGDGWRTWKERERV